METKTIKTEKGWHESGMNLGRYLEPGDIVDEDMYYYFLGVLPPITNTATALQIGEPYNSVKGEFTYHTLIKLATKEFIDTYGDNWVYAGAIPKHIIKYVQETGKTPEIYNGV